MYISFHTKLIRDICENEKCSIDNIGNDHTKFLQIKLADIEASENVYDIPSDTPVILNKNNKECISLKIVSPNELLLLPAHKSPPILEDKLNWQKVIRVKIREIKGLS